MPAVTPSLGVSPSRLLPAPLRCPLSPGDTCQKAAHDQDDRNDGRHVNNSWRWTHRAESGEVLALSHQGQQAGVLGEILGCRGLGRSSHTHVPSR